MHRYISAVARARRPIIVIISAVLIAFGTLLLTWGMATWIMPVAMNPPSAKEQMLLARGREVTEELTAPASGPRVILPDNSPQSEKSPPSEVQSPATEVPSRTPDTGRPTPNPTPARLPAQSAPTRIVAPSIKLDAKVVEIGWKVINQGNQQMSVWETADYAAGFHKTSAYPGNPGNTVISGHHNIKGEVFRYLVDLEIGDAITLYADGRPYVYRVFDKFIVREEGAPLEQRYKNAAWISHFDDERLTLVTCWPYTTNTHRVIVIARPVLEPNPDTSTTSAGTLSDARP